MIGVSLDKRYGYPDERQAPRRDVSPVPSRQITYTKSETNCTSNVKRLLTGGYWIIEIVFSWWLVV